MIFIRDIKLPINHNDGAIKAKIIDILNLKKLSGRDFSDSVKEYIIHRKSIDARKKPDIYYIYSIYVSVDKECEKLVRNYVSKKHIKNVTFEEPIRYILPKQGEDRLQKRPVIIGAGPAGLFCAYILSQKGFKPIVIERGESVDDRLNTVNKIWATGIVNKESNVQFGEGGAGTFSDGKLNTLTKDVLGRNTYVLQTFHEFGAPVDITYNAKPHIGTDLLRDVVKNMRNKIIDNGGQFIFNTKLTEIICDNDKSRDNRQITGINVINTLDGAKSYIDTDVVVLCIGHSARDTFEYLYDLGISMEQKSFAVGYRVQHPQERVNMWQYGVSDSKSIGLESADYKVTNEASNGRRVYSFCMCPGGYVVNASSEEEQIAVNGMSERGRDSGYANSAIIAAITPDDFIQDCVSANHPLSGMYYQKNIEHSAYIKGNGIICGQYFSDYENNKPTESFADTICTKGEVKAGNLRGIYSDSIDEAIIESIHKFGYTRKGFDAEDVILYGVESRTSSPIRINRDECFESNISGIYPCGEGAGYAGGITSAATDGIKVAEAIVSRFYPEYTDVEE